jgi:hypothetical protein
MGFMGPGPYGMDMHMYPPPPWAQGPPMNSMMGMGPPFPGMNMGSMGYYPYPGGGMGGYGGPPQLHQQQQQQQQPFGSFDYQPHNQYSAPARQPTPPTSTPSGSTGKDSSAPASYQADFPALG